MRSAPHLRYLASLTPAQRQEALSREGLGFTGLSLPQQQQFIALALERQPDRAPSLGEPGNATLRVDYTVPGWFQRQRPPAPGEPRWQELILPPVRERSRDAALREARCVEPQVDPMQIVPTELSLTVAYLWGQAGTRLSASVRSATPDGARVVAGWREGDSSSITDILRKG